MIFTTPDTTGCTHVIACTFGVYQCKLCSRLFDLEEPGGSVVTVRATMDPPDEMSAELDSNWAGLTKRTDTPLYKLEEFATLADELEESPATKGVAMRIRAILEVR